MCSPHYRAYSELFTGHCYRILVQCMLESAVSLVCGHRSKVKKIPLLSCEVTKKPIYLIYLIVKKGTNAV